MKLFSVEGGRHVPQCPITGDATEYTSNVQSVWHLSPRGWGGEGGKWLSAPSSPADRRLISYEYLINITGIPIVIMFANNVSSVSVYSRLSQQDISQRRLLFSDRSNHPTWLREAPLILFWPQIAYAICISYCYCINNRILYEQQLGLQLLLL